MDLHSKLRYISKILRLYKGILQYPFIRCNMASEFYIYIYYYYCCCFLLLLLIFRRTFSSRYLISKLSLQYLGYMRYSLLDVMRRLIWVYSLSSGISLQYLGYVRYSKVSIY